MGFLLLSQLSVDNEDYELLLVSPPKSNCLPVLNFMPKLFLPTLLCDSNVAFDMTFPPRCDNPLVATCSKVIIHSHTSPIDILLLPTDYHHIALVAESKSLIVFNHTHNELAFKTLFRQIYFPSDFYALLRVSLTRFHTRVRKKLDHSLERNIFDWPWHLNEGFVFNIAKLFEPLILQ